MITIFHLSDLHFAENTSRSKPLNWKKLENIKGIEGHDLKIWTSLKDHLKSRIGKTNNEYRICVTGDLSRIGSIDSYNVASELFFDESISDISKEFGLRLNRDKFIIVPGNHDCYDASLSKMNNLRTFNGVFHNSEEEYPIVKEIKSDNTNYSFVILQYSVKF
jgi:3',5'-cyclic AMP phosphodiesterase CpdA